MESLDLDEIESFTIRINTIGEMIKNMKNTSNLCFYKKQGRADNHSSVIYYSEKKKMLLCENCLNGKSKDSFKKIMTILEENKNNQKNYELLFNYRNKVDVFAKKYDYYTGLIEKRIEQLNHLKTRLNHTKAFHNSVEILDENLTNLINENYNDETRLISFIKLNENLNLNYDYFSELLKEKGKIIIDQSSILSLHDSYVSDLSSSLRESLFIFIEQVNNHVNCEDSRNKFAEKPNKNHELKNFNESSHNISRKDDLNNTNFIDLRNSKIISQSNNHDRASTNQSISFTQPNSEGINSSVNMSKLSHDNTDQRKTDSNYESNFQQNTKEKKKESENKIANSFRMNIPSGENNSQIIFINGNKVFYSDSEKTIKCCEIDKTLTDSISFVNHNNSLHITGGKGETQNQYHVVYMHQNDKANMIKIDSNLNCGRYNHCSFIHEGILYALGGDGRSDVERYNFNQNKWDVYPYKMNNKRSRSCAMIVNTDGSQYIYAFLGYQIDNDKKEYFTTIERANLKLEGNWENLEVKNNNYLKRHSSSIMKKNNKDDVILIFGGNENRDILEFNPIEKEIIICTSKLPQAAGFINMNFINVEGEYINANVNNKCFIFKDGKISYWRCDNKSSI